MLAKPPASKRLGAKMAATRAPSRAEVPTSPPADVPRLGHRLTLELDAALAEALRRLAFEQHVTAAALVRAAARALLADPASPTFAAVLESAKAEAAELRRRR